MKRDFLLAVLTIFLSSCSFLPAGTDMWIQRKLNNTPLGSSKEQVQSSLGNPIYRIKYPNQDARVEIWGYDVGNYWYHESLTLFFRDNQFIGMPRTPYDLFVFMHQLRLIDAQTEFIAGRPVGE